MTDEDRIEAVVQNITATNISKPRMDLLPADALRGVAEAFTHGISKHDDRGWEGGAPWGACHLAAALRHIGEWQMGMEIDQESGLSPLDHAAARLLMLSALVKRGVGTDDRRPS